MSFGEAEKGADAGTEIYMPAWATNISARTSDSNCSQLENELTPGDDAEVESPSHFSHPGSADDVRCWRQRLPLLTAASSSAGDDGDVESPR